MLPPAETCHRPGCGNPTRPWSGRGRRPLYCSLACRNHRYRGTEPTPRATICECGKPIAHPATGRPRTYCSDECYRAADKRRDKPPPRSPTCQACGRPFEFQGLGVPRRCPDCRAAGIKGPPRECTECSQMFWPRTHTAKQCDRHACRSAARRRIVTAASAAAVTAEARRGGRRGLRNPDAYGGAATLKGQRYIRELSAPGLSRSKRWKLVAQWRRQGRMCVYCGVRPADTHDHAVPLYLGGTNFEGNLVPACRPCNTSKGNQTIMEWRMKRSGPRQRWTA